jgi:hypothetical protein
VLDRVRDGVDFGLQHAPGRARPALETASRNLTQVAHRIEHAPPMKSGEDPSTHRG